MHILMIAKNRKRVAKLKKEFSKSNIIPTVARPSEIDKLWLTQFHLVKIHPSISELECQNTAKIIRNLNYEIPILIPFELEEPISKTQVIPKDTTLPQLKRLMYSMIIERKSINLNKIKYKDLTLDINKRILTRKDRIVKLRNKEFGIIELLMRKNGEVVSKNEIIEKIWDRNAEITSNTIPVHMSELRKKIDDGFSKKLIHTIYCTGYRLGE